MSLSLGCPTLLASSRHNASHRDAIVAYMGRGGVHLRPLYEAPSGHVDSVSGFVKRYEYIEK
jgi:hypothetical protein